jgi:hypothetical protein
MDMEKRLIRTLVAVGIALILMMPLAGCGTKKSLEAGSTWEIAETTSLAGLTIAEGAAIKAPEGNNVTLSVDGVGTAIKPGEHKGKIVLTVTEEFQIGSQQGPGGGGIPGGGPGGAGGGMPEGGPGGAPDGGQPPAAGGPPGGAGGGMPVMPDMSGMPGGGARGAEVPWKAAIYLENGKYIPEKSVAAIVAAGKVTDTSADDVKITSNEGKFNGIIVTGDTKSAYTITNPVISLNENGGDDATGQGMGILVAGKAEVTV